MLGSCSVGDHRERPSPRESIPGWASRLQVRVVTVDFLPDLRWTDIGLLGGRALVNCLPRNKTLWRLELAGNNVPGDILRAVGTGTPGCRQLTLFGAGDKADSLGRAQPLREGQLGAWDRDA